jgi:uncharacterized protein YcaQ
LWRTGALAVARRVSFQKVYDLTERVLPVEAARPKPTLDETADWACSTALERLGVATPAELAAFWSAIGTPRAARWCRDAARDGRAVPVLVDSVDGAPPRPAFARSDWRARAARGAPPPGMRLLSPFDPLVRDRQRARRLFGFDYTFEAFVPAGKRRFGYYVLPILEGDRLVGRLDPKVHRERALLEVRGLWWERGVRATRARDVAIEEAVARLARTLGAERFTIRRRPR